MKVAFAGLLLVAVLVLPTAAADQTGTYTFFNPWSPVFPDCVAAPGGLSLGLGGACFTVPDGVDRYRVTLEDDVLGPGFGLLNLCDQNGCGGIPICNGVAEGAVPTGTTRASVVALDPFMAHLFCGVDAIGWVPTHGTITLNLTDSDA